MDVVGDEFAVWRVTVSATPSMSPRAASGLARELGIPLKSAQALLKSGEFSVPMNLTKEAAIALAETLRASGLKVDPQPVTHPPTIPCATHTKLANGGQCKDCGRWICIVERAEHLGLPICESCFNSYLTRRTIRWVRTAVLLAVLVGVAIWGWSEQQRREDRRLWKRPLSVGVFVVEDGDVDPEAISGLSRRAEEISEVLTVEYSKYGGSIAPFEFHVLPAIELPGELPRLQGDGFFQRTQYTFEMWGFRRRVESSISGDLPAFDSRVYLIVRPARGKQPRMFEGLAARDGDFGVVEIELSSDTIDLAVITATHEMLHTLGASDKYDMETGTALYPDGFATPQTKYPQKYMEIMAHDIPLSDSTSRLPSLVGEVRMGPKTAREIGWGK